MYRTRFTWKRSPIEVLKEKLEMVGLQLDVFKEEPILFNKLKNGLSRKFQTDKFHKYRKFTDTMNKDDFQ